MSEGVALRGDALTYSNEVEIDAFSFVKRLPDFSDRRNYVIFDFLEFVLKGIVAD